MPSSEPKTRNVSMPVNPVGIEAGAAGVMIRLKPIEASDRDWFLATLTRNRESLARWLPLNQPGETDDMFFERQRVLCEEGDRSQKSFRRSGVMRDGTPAGFFALNSISRGLAWEADAIWWVDSGFRGRGVATAGVCALLDHAFGDLPGGLGLHGVHCGIEAGNDPSVRVAEKCGFVHDPSKRSHLQVGDRWAMHEFYLATPASFDRLRGNAD